MGLFSGKRGVVMGVANERSIATGIAKFLSDEGAEIGLSYLPDEKGRMKSRVERASEGLNIKFMHPCDVNSEESLQDFFEQTKKTFTSIDFLVHSIAYAPTEDIKCQTIYASRKGFQIAMESSCYSFIACCREASEILNSGASILTLSYFGGEKVVAGYNLMGVAKAALEASVKYLAYELGPKNIRVNSISAGPIKTLAASGVGDFQDMMRLNESIAPLERNVSTTEVGQSAGFLLSSYASGITGENLHVDAGYNIMGSPGLAFKKWGINPREKRI